MRSHKVKKVKFGPFYDMCCRVCNWTICLEIVVVGRNWPHLAYELPAIGIFCLSFMFLDKCRTNLGLPKKLKITSLSFLFQNEKNSDGEIKELKNIICVAYIIFIPYSLVEYIYIIYKGCVYSYTFNNSGNIFV